jgi:hypothetical protein
MDETPDRPPADELPEKPTIWPVDQPTSGSTGTPTDDPTGQVPQQSGADVLNGMRDAFERLGKEVLSTAEDVSSGRRPVLPDGVRSSLADLASGLSSLADGAARSLGEWSRKLESESRSTTDTGMGTDTGKGTDTGTDGAPGAGRHSSPS